MQWNAKYKENQLIDSDNNDHFQISANGKKKKMQNLINWSVDASKIYFEDTEKLDIRTKVL